MANWHSIQKHIDRGKGFAAKRLSQPYDVYRIQDFSCGDWFNEENKVASDVLAAYRKGIRLNPGLETVTNHGTHFYEVVGNMEPYLLGDIFLQKDPIYDKGATSVTWPQTDQFNGLAICGHHPLKKVFAARVDRLVTVMRPAEAPDVHGFFSPTMDAAQPLILDHGVFKLGELTATPVKIPAGFAALYRPYGPELFTKVPGMTKSSLWFIYVPALQGFTFVEGDRIIDSQGGRYVVFNPWGQLAGITGSQLICEREATQN